MNMMQQKHPVFRALHVNHISPMCSHKRGGTKLVTYFGTNKTYFNLAKNDQRRNHARRMHRAIPDGALAARNSARLVNSLDNKIDHVIERTEHRRDMCSVAPFE